ncbi:hypothetical protein [Microcoleus sp. OTE_8_concoct_300]|uniref:hypothetical protein n=1 Tax=Microcoleus sp. OTE_8_concoct_300 TaxID=2964710 RepID=UPI00403FC001
MRKTQPATGFDVACKWKRNYGAWKVDAAWFILTDLGSLPAAIDAYKQRMGIEEMFRDCKTGGYDLEGTSTARRKYTDYICGRITYSVSQKDEVSRGMLQRWQQRDF